MSILLLKHTKYIKCSSNVTQDIKVHFLKTTDDRAFIMCFTVASFNSYFENSNLEQINFLNTNVTVNSFSDYQMSFSTAL